MEISESERDNAIELREVGISFRKMAIGLVEIYSRYFKLEMSKLQSKSKDVAEIEFLLYVCTIGIND